MRKSRFTEDQIIAILKESEPGTATKELVRGPSVSAEQLTRGATALVAERAQDFIEVGFRSPMGMEELCTFVGVGLRTLQRSFRLHFHVTPTQYIKARRLNEARRELATADPSNRSVTEIALANGFRHLGRFSVAYRAFFGESPRETLARRA